MTLIPQFLTSVQRLKRLVDEGPLSLMTRVALAVADTLPDVEGTAICLALGPGARVAVGVSDGEALLAEQLEYTVGAGPGIDAHRRREHVVAGGGFGRRWPALHDALLTATGFRAVRAVPLTAGRPEEPLGVLLLLYASAAAADDVTDSGRRDIGQLSLLIGHAVSVGGEDLAQVLRPRGRDTVPDIRRRLAVETAVGIVMTTYALPAADALDLLRGYAYTRTQLIDDIAHDLVTGRLTVDAFA